MILPRGVGTTPHAPGNWSDGATGVLLQYDEVADSDGHFVIFDREDARQQSTQFLATEASDGVSTLVAP